MIKEMIDIISNLIHQLVDEGQITIKLGTPESKAFIDLAKHLLPKSKQ